MKLTQRQIDILAEVGLPIDYSELTSSQRNDIMAIEELLCYLEDTYHQDVTYLSFTQGSMVNDESLLAKMDGYEVTVSRRFKNGVYVYSDDYAELKATAQYEEEIKAFFVSRGLEVKVYAEINKLTNGTDNLLSSVNAAVYVFVCGDKSRTELEELTAAYGAWYAPQLKGVANVTRLHVVDELEYMDIGKENYNDCRQEISAEKRIICVISSDGSVTTA